MTAYSTITYRKETLSHSSSLYPPYQLYNEKACGRIQFFSFNKNLLKKKPTNFLSLKRCCFLFSNHLFSYFLYLLNNNNSLGMKQMSSNQSIQLFLRKTVHSSFYINVFCISFQYLFLFIFFVCFICFFFLFHLFNISYTSISSYMLYNAKVN